MFQGRVLIVSGVRRPHARGYRSSKCPLPRDVFPTKVDLLEQRASNRQIGKTKIVLVRTTVASAFGSVKSQTRAMTANSSTIIALFNRYTWGGASGTTITYATSVVRRRPRRGDIRTRMIRQEVPSGWRTGRAQRAGIGSVRRFVQPASLPPIRPRLREGSWRRCSGGHSWRPGCQGEWQPTVIGANNHGQFRATENCKFKQTVHTTRTFFFIPSDLHTVGSFVNKMANEGRSSRSLDEILGQVSVSRVMTNGVEFSRCDGSGALERPESAETTSKRLFFDASASRTRYMAGNQRRDFFLYRLKAPRAVISPREIQSHLSKCFSRKRNTEVVLCGSSVRQCLMLLTARSASA